jgi:hypothetical protein
MIYKENVYMALPDEFISDKPNTIFRLALYTYEEIEFQIRICIKNPSHASKILHFINTTS